MFRLYEVNGSGSYILILSLTFVTFGILPVLMEIHQLVQRIKSYWWKKIKNMDFRWFFMRFKLLRFNLLKIKKENDLFNKVMDIHFPKIFTDANNTDTSALSFEVIKYINIPLKVTHTLCILKLFWRKSLQWVSNGVNIHLLEVSMLLKICCE